MIRIKIVVNQTTEILRVEEIIKILIEEIIETLQEIIEILTQKVKKEIKDIDEMRKMWIIFIETTSDKTDDK